MRLRQIASLGALLIVGTAASIHARPDQDSNAGGVTFNKQVLPILQKNCQACHRPGEIGPMSFLTYEETRPLAKAIKEAVLMRKMPPWFADAQIGHFANERRLTDADIRTLVDWVDRGAPEGVPKDKPAPVKWIDGWNIKPDIVYTMPKPYAIPATGVLLEFAHRRS